MKKNITVIALLVSLCVLLTCSVLYLLVPSIAERYVLPAIAAEMPFSRVEISISRLSPWQMRGTLSLGGEKQPGISVARFEAHYSPTMLLQRTIGRVVIDGAGIHLQKRDGRFALRGLVVKNSSAQRQEWQGGHALPALPLVVRKIVVNNSRVVLHGIEEADRVVWLDGQITSRYVAAGENSKKLAAFTADLQSKGALEMQAKIGMRPVQQQPSGQSIDGTGRRSHVLDFTVVAEDLGEALRYQHLFQDTEAAGRLRLQGEVEVEGITDIVGYTAGLELDGFTIQQPGLIMQSADEDEPVTLTLAGDTKKFEYALTGLRLRQPAGCDVSAEGSYVFDSAKVDGMAALALRPASSSMGVVYQGTLGQQTVLDFRLAGEPFTVNNSLDIAPYTAEGSVTISGPQISGNLQGAVPSIKDRARDIELTGLSFSLPFSLPARNADTVSGTLEIEQIRFKDEHSGTFSASLAFKDDRVVGNGLMTTPLHDAFALSCSGSATLKRDMRLDCRLPEVAITAGNMPSYVTLPDSLHFSGKVEGELHYASSREEHGGQASIAFTDAEVHYEKYTLADIAGSLDFPLLPRIQTSPNQRITVGRIELGKIVMSDASINLRLDDPGSLLIERARLNWCGGRVETGGVYIKNDMETLNTTLYCDRLGYTELLAQLGVGDAEGQGALNGRLPLIIDEKGVEFDNGFLFSTPGEGGIVRFRNTARLRQGMSAMKKTVYLDYSMDALENFSYNWTKLTFNTEAGELLVALELDGKPAEPLQYRYERGNIVPIGKQQKSTEQEQGIRHPIRLNVNFRLPLSEFFHYGKNIHSMMENI
ncbi:MAG: YdbH domain-containing protein [Desulfopila sp.]